MRNQRSEQRKLDQLFDLFDTDHSNVLGPSELKKAVREVNINKYGKPMEPSDDDVKFMIKTCGAAGSDGIDRKELKKALSAWDMYVDSKEHTDMIFDKYDVNRSGRLERPQLRAYLLDILALEGEYGITEDDVEYVLKHADKTETGSVTKMELHGASAAFMKRRDEEKQTHGTAICNLM